MPLELVKCLNNEMKKNWNFPHKYNGTHRHFCATKLLKNVLYSTVPPLQKPLLLQPFFLLLL